MILGVMNLAPLKTAETNSEVITYTSDNISPGFNELDPYVKVGNNSFILRLPDNVRLSDELNIKITNHLNSINQSIDENSLVIDPLTGIAKI